MKNKLYQFKDLVDRLGNVSASREKDVVFLVGSAVSLPDHEGGHGVSGVSDIVELIRQEFSASDAVHEIHEFDEAISTNSENQYQEAFEFLHAKRGQDAANAIVRAAVWRAIDLDNWPSSLPLTNATSHEIDPNICRALENEVHAWKLPRAVDMLGGLLVKFPDTFGKVILTTNFDPLIEVSIRKNGGSRYRTVLPADGNLEQTVSEGIHVIHLHGFWSGYDTLHTPRQLGRPRPKLKRSLARILESSTLVVVGYGGWDDAITQTLAEIVLDPMSTPEILWTFFEDNDADIEKVGQKLLSSLAPGIQQGRVQLYQGVDCRSLFHEVFRRLKPHYPTPIDPATGSHVSTTVREISSGRSGRRQVRIAVDFDLPDLTSSETDSPLIVEPWIGRDQELSILASATTPVAFITGIGGQGKSALAGRFLQLQCLREPPRFSFWDWRDCKEESDRLTTQLLRQIERLSGGAIDTGRIETTDVRAVVDVFFHVMGERSALFVFDNVDQYVDLEFFRLTKGLDYLVSEAQARSHHCLFLFTCRPNIEVDESRTLRLPLEGLTVEETGELISARGLPQRDRHLTAELHRTTKGHPLWISLIVMHVVRGSSDLSSALQEIVRGGAELPDTTRTIWRTLNDQQRSILRTMAELDRPESESQLRRLLPGVNFSRVYRALKTLRSYHLVEVRTQVDGEPLLGLHPLIRQFIRTEFPKQDREKYVGTILEYLEDMIGQFRSFLSQEPSFQILEYWSRKAELQIRFGHFEDATSTISEIGPSLVSRGYSEEFVRLVLQLLRECDWAIACISYRQFDEVFQRCINLMIQFGHEEDVDGLLTKYGDAVPGKSSQFILLCDLRCYAKWYAGDFESAIRWGEEGNRLKEETLVDTAYSSRHNLTLARRDGGFVADALEMFLDGIELSKVVTPGEKIEGKDAAFYGNIGRCLFFSERFDEALVCYIKSAQLLQEGRSNRDHVNRGYIRLWIAELLLLKEETELVAAFLRAAVCIWNDVSPPRSRLAEGKLLALVENNEDLREYVVEEDWRVEGVFSRWLDLR